MILPDLVPLQGCRPSFRAASCGPTVHDVAAVLAAETQAIRLVKYELTDWVCRFSGGQNRCRECGVDHDYRRAGRGSVDRAAFMSVGWIFGSVKPADELDVGIVGRVLRITHGELYLLAPIVAVGAPPGDPFPCQVA